MKNNYLPMHNTDTDMNNIDIYRIMRNTRFYSIDPNCETKTAISFPFSYLLNSDFNNPIYVIAWDYQQDMLPLTDNKYVKLTKEQAKIAAKIEAEREIKEIKRYNGDYSFYEKFLDTNINCL